jgi:lysozyme
VKISSRGLDLIKRFEGLRLTAYKDAVGVWTIGYGHTRTAAAGQVIDIDRAESLLISDASEAEDAINRLVRQPLDQGEYDALVSLVFNIGASAFSRSTLLRLLNSKSEPWRIGAEFLRWVYASGKRLRGLERRRLAERAMYLGGA